MAEENAPLENAADEAKKAADAAKAGVKKAGSALAGLTGLKPANKGGAPAAKPATVAAETAAPESAAAPAKPVAAAPSAIKPGAGLKPAAGAGLKPATAGAGLKPGAPGAGLKAAAPGAGLKPAAPAAAGVDAPKPAAAAPAKKEEAAVFTPPTGVSRREFLNYVWGASIALFTAQFGGLTFFFAFPRFRPGQFGGKIPTDVAKIPELNKPPVPNDVGKFWLVNTDEGINVLYKICTHLGCIYPWSDAAGIFACPCHGSQFKLGGEWIAGPAPRSLDKFEFAVLDASGTTLATVSDGKPIPLPAGAATLLVNTGKKIDGASHF